MWNCNICQKEMDTNGYNTDTNYNVSFYHGKKPKPSEGFIMCETCYQDKEQEYLVNYERIFKETKKEGIKFIKKPEIDCYASQKDQNGKILKQTECRHCQP